MSFLKRNLNEEEPDSSGDKEELYEELFPKIGRDFIYKEDFYRAMNLLMILIDPLGLNPIDFFSDVEARNKALEYKMVLDSGRDGSKIYRDLINLNEDD